jgi:hypothetical protein
MTGRADVATRSAGPSQPRFELRCTTCRYGVIVRIAPATCPVCHGTVWEYATPLRPALQDRKEQS